MMEAVRHTVRGSQIPCVCVLWFGVVVRGVRRWMLLEQRRTERAGPVLDSFCTQVTQARAFKACIKLFPV
ncbi:hypothetical protein UPYG_G00243840 [Umbra pygmaea]|uniref:Secreted protein n=1 Tax=Umbra pygmaea TaxID=75934 RepID=A0ABD0WFW0_UMBPY